MMEGKAFNRGRLRQKCAPPNLGRGVPCLNGSPRNVEYLHTVFMRRTLIAILFASTSVFDDAGIKFLDQEGGGWKLFNVRLR